MSCCIFQFLTGCRCCNRICCQRRQRPVCNLGSLNFIPSVSRPTATQELRRRRAMGLSTDSTFMVSSSCRKASIVMSSEACLLRT